MARIVSLHVIGEPTLKLTYSGTAAPGQTHVYAQIEIVLPIAG